jgi:hypothetical protein
MYIYIPEELRELEFAFKATKMVFNPKIDPFTLSTPLPTDTLPVHMYMYIKTYMYVYIGEQGLRDKELEGVV